MGVISQDFHRRRLRAAALVCHNSSWRFRGVRAFAQTPQMSRIRVRIKPTQRVRRRSRPPLETSMTDLPPPPPQLSRPDWLSEKKRMIALKMSSQRETLAVGDTSFLFLSSHASIIGEICLSRQEDNKMPFFPGGGRGRGGGDDFCVKSVCCLLLCFSEWVNYLFLSEIIQQGG